MILVALVDKIFGNFGDFKILGKTGVVPDIGLLLQNIHNSYEGVLEADGNGHHKRLGTKHVLGLLDHAIEISADPVQLVHENDAGNFRIVGVTPVGLGLRLNATGAAENTDTAVKNLKRTVNLDGEVNVSRSINDIHPVVVPETSGRGRLNGNSTLSFLLHEIGGGLTIVDLTRFVNLSGELEDSLGGGGFSSINVGEDADITVFSKVNHGNCLLRARVIIITPPFCRVWTETFYSLMPNIGFKLTQNMGHSLGTWPTDLKDCTLSPR